MANAGIRTALYLRISKDDAETGLAVERQRDECLRVIAREGLEVVETYTDNGVSAYSRGVKRPGFDKMTADYERGKFSVVVCWDMDRFSRQPAQLERWIELGESRGLRILTPTETTDLSTDNGRMFARIKAATARAEVERKSVRQKAQALQAKANGTYKARVGFNDAATIKRIFAAVLAGEKVYAIGAKLNAEGSKTLAGNPWSGQAVRRVVMTPRHRGTTVPETSFDDAQVLVTGRERVGAKARGLYSGVAVCGGHDDARPGDTCGASMTASGDRYKCAFATNHPGSKGHVTVLRTAMESAIDKAMVAAFALGRESLEPRATDVAALDVELARVGEARRRIVALVSLGSDAGGLSVEEASGELRELSAKAERLEERRREVIASNAHAQMLDGLVSAVLAPGRVSLDDVGAVKARIAERWAALADDKRRELAREILDVTIHPAGAPERLIIVHRVVTTLNAEADAESAP